MSTRSNRTALPAPTLNASFAARFWARVERRAPDECWPWTGAKSAGYGNFCVWDHGRALGYKAHRLAYMLTHGPIEGRFVFVCHSCDNPVCCNPARLWLGTPSDNTHDMIAKGRALVPRSTGSRPRTHCRRGHELTPENSAPAGKGRTCRICKNAGVRERRRAMRNGNHNLSEAA